MTTYTGTTGAATIKDDNIKFTPDFVWLKSRSNSEGHALYDTVRGSTGGNFYRLRSDTTDAQNSPTNELSSMIEGGFTVNNNGHCYYDGYTYVGWCWKAGGNKNTFNVDDIGYASAAAAGLTAGTITPTGASVGTKQGFSIIKYTGNSTANATLPHGLSEAPKFVMIKNLDNTYGWAVLHTDVGTTGTTLDGSPEYYMLQLDSDAARNNFSEDTIWNPTSTTVKIDQTGGANWVNNSNSDYIAYLWHDVPGLQKFGIYTGNGDADGPFIELGFRPAVLITKRYDGGNNNWQLVDAERSPFNVANTIVKPDQNAAESTHADYAVDFLSNGFKHRTAHIARNDDGNTYIYMAWAEAPTIDLYGGGANAR